MDRKKQQGSVSDDVDQVSVLLAPLLAWIDEVAEDPLVRLQRIDVAYAQIAELVKLLGSNGRRGEAVRQLIHEYGVDRAVEMSGYSKATIQRIAWQ